MLLHTVDWKDFAPESFRLFQNRQPLLSAGDRSRCNTMTIGWGQLGTLWNLPVCTVYVRPERHTYAFMEAYDHFALSVLPEGSGEITRFCGTRSGREVDKVQACGLTLDYGAGDAPFFQEAEVVLVCKKLYVQDLAPSCVVDGRIHASYGEKGGWHRAYTGQVLEVYQK